LTETAEKSPALVQELNAMWDTAALLAREKILLLRTMSHIETLTRELIEARK
jgi:hypothetical protein